jgi:two-component system, LytTR family, response regulator
MQIRSFLADDEQAARLRLRRLLEACPQIQIVGEAANGIEAVEAIERLHPQLILLDIQMPGLNGFEVLRALSKDIARPLTIFVTGFHEHALEAFRARAIAYLLKPIEEEHLREMLERAGHLLASISSREEEDRNVNRLLGDDPFPMEQIVARKANQVFLLDPTEALFFYMDAGIVRVRVENDTYWVNYQLGELEQALESRGFFRARRSSLVNLKRVKEIRSDPRSSFVLVMRDAKNTEVEVSERQGRALRTRIPGL